MHCWHTLSQGGRFRCGTARYDHTRHNVRASEQARRQVERFALRVSRNPTPCSVQLALYFPPNFAGKVTMDGVSQFLDKNSEALVEVSLDENLTHSNAHTYTYTHTHTHKHTQTHLHAHTNPRRC
jgi:hypothetical protein